MKVRFFFIFLIFLQIFFYKLTLSVRVQTIETLRHVLLHLFCDRYQSVTIVSSFFCHWECQYLFFATISSIICQLPYFLVRYLIIYESLRHKNFSISPFSNMHFWIWISCHQMAKLFFIQNFWLVAAYIFQIYRLDQTFTHIINLTFYSEYRTTASYEYVVTPSG